MCSGAILLYRIPRIVVGENVTSGARKTCCGTEAVAVDRGSGRALHRDDAAVHRRAPAIWNEDIGV